MVSETKNKKNLTIVFDMDGTLADTMQLLLSIVNEMSEDYDYQKVDEVDVARLRNGGVKEFITHLGLSFFKIPKLVATIKKKLHTRISEVKPFFKMKDVLIQLKEEGYDLGIVSSNSQENIEAFVKNNQLNYFDFMYEAENIFSKVSSLKTLLRKHKLDAETTIYVGDEIRDVKACKKVGLPIIAVTWGFNSKLALTEYEPDYIAEEAENIPTYVKMIEEETRD